MRTSWLITLAAGAAISAAAPAELLAQGNSNRARPQQQRVQQRPQQQREQAREREQAARERERQQAREQARQQAQRTPALRQQRQQRQQGTQVPIRRDRDDRYDRRDDRDRRYDDRRWDDRRWDDRRWDDRRYDDRWDRRGPAFCRSGQGHPVYGRQWCRDKGFGLGRERSHDIWGDIIYRQPRDRRYDDRRLSRGTLGDILGSVILGRFDTYGRTYYGNNGMLSGRWLDNGIMQLYFGTALIARLVDFDGDGRVDDVILVR